MICGELLCLAVALSVFPVVMMMAAAEEGSASGWMKVKDQRVALKYAFAAMSEDVLEGGGKEKIEVLLSDKPVPMELRKATDAWSSWAGDAGATGRITRHHPLHQPGHEGVEPGPEAISKRDGVLLAIGVVAGVERSGLRAGLRGLPVRSRARFR